jgi:hypothetical protein
MSTPRLSFLLYKTQSPSPMGLKIGQSLMGLKFQPFRPEWPENFLLVLFSKIL